MYLREKNVIAAKCTLMFLQDDPDNNSKATNYKVLHQPTYFLRHE